MAAPLPIPVLVEEWLAWAKWISDPARDESKFGDYIGFDEFEWITHDHPEHAWVGILAVVHEPRADPYLGLLAAGPIEDLLSHHGGAFIDRMEVEAKANEKFASLFSGVDQYTMQEEIWQRVQALSARVGSDG